jgi:hypothetical protein
MSLGHLLSATFLIATAACGGNALGQEATGSRTVVSGKMASAISLALEDFETTIHPSGEEGSDHFFSDLGNYQVSVEETDEGFVVVFNVVVPDPRIGKTEDGRITLDLVKGGGARYVVREGEIVDRELFR